MPTSYKYLTIMSLIALLLSGCAFYSKDFVSRIKIDGKNYRNERGDEGVFYIDDSPLLSLRTGCNKRTNMANSMSIIIPSPAQDKAKYHDSLATQTFHLTLSHAAREKIDLSNIDINIQIADVNHVLKFENVTHKGFGGHVYTYSSGIYCSDIKDGILTIKLKENKIRIYGIQFYEGIDRDISYQPYFTT